jgi:HAD superfamily hydrolase (TIGR01509 family)
MEYVFSRNPAAVLWDMDGTIVDTEPLWIAAEQDLVRSHGGTWTEADSLALVGSELLVAGEYIRKKADLPITASEVVDRLLGEVLAGVKQGVQWRPGAVQLLSSLKAAGVPCALVTMSYRVLADAVISQLPSDTFAAVITGDSVSKGKPHPEPYLAAAAELGVDAGECVVIEDSPNGVNSGLAAGMRVLGVPNTVDIEARPGLVVIESLAGLTPQELWSTFDAGSTGR